MRRSRREEAGNKLAHFVCVHFYARNVEVAQIDEQTAVDSFVSTLFVAVAIARIVRVSGACVFAGFDEFVVTVGIKIVTAVLRLEVVVESLARRDIIFARRIVDIRVGEQFKRTARHINAEQIVIVRIVTALGLKNYAEIDKACDVCYKLGQSGLTELIENFFEQINNHKQVHISVELVVVSYVFDEFGAEIVEQCRYLDIRLYDELERTVYVALRVGLCLDFEQIFTAQSRQECFEHCAQIDVAAVFEARGDIDSLFERETVYVVKVGIFCKFVTAQNVCTRIGERYVEVFDCQRKFERGVVLRAVGNVGLVGLCSRYEFVNLGVCEREDILCAVKDFRTVALVVIDYSLCDDFLGYGVVFDYSQSLVSFACQDVFVFVWRNCTEVLTGVA